MARLAIPLSILLAAAGIFGWRELQSFEARVAGLVEQVAELETDVEVAKGRVRAEGERADAAERRAAQAELAAADAESQALARGEEASVAEQQAAAEAATRARAEKDRTDSLEIARIRASEAKLAELEREDARKEAERLREERERDLARLQRAFEKIAETRSTALGLVMRLGEDSIEFDFDKADLRPGNRELLARIAGVLLTAEDYQIQVFGHTDDVGTEEYNVDLSKRRAGVVRDYLVEAGVDPKIISTKGFGEGSPLVEGDDDKSRQRNRRVEIAVTQTTGELSTTSVVERGGRAQATAATGRGATAIGGWVARCGSQ